MSRAVPVRVSGLCPGESGAPEPAGERERPGPLSPVSPAETAGSEGQQQQDELRALTENFRPVFSFLSFSEDRKHPSSEDVAGGLCLPGGRHQHLSSQHDQTENFNSIR